MKCYLIICFLLLSVASYSQSSGRQIDSSFYVVNNDTVYFQDRNEILQCDFMTTRAKAHNKCSIYLWGELFTGDSKIVFFTKDKSKIILEGTIKNGLIQDGYHSEFFSNGTPKLTGQYLDNWKYGYWVNYTEKGMVKWIGKYIIGASHPILEFEFDDYGNLIYFNDEENQIEQIMKNNH